MVMIVQVVGYQNSGKTTLMTEMIGYFQAQGYRVGALKHHGHDASAPTIAKEKDSYRYLQAGADVSMVEGDGTFQLLANFPEEDIEMKLRLLQCFDLDIVFIEGYKNLSYPKVLMLRQEEDLQLIDTLNHVIAICAFPALIKKVEQRSLVDNIFSIHDRSRFLEWLKGWVIKEMNKPA